VRGKPFAWIAAASLAGLLAIATAAAVLVLRSHWFYEQVRLRVVSTVETATGGRVDAASFQFDWTRLRAEIRGFVLHGLEPRDSPPLFRASSVAAGLKIVSLLKRDVDIQYLEIVEPRIHLIIDPDGRTNVPEPKIKSRDQRTTVETILSLAIGRFDVQDGLFEVQWDRRPAPSSQTFSAHGRNLRAHFLYELAGPRYRGTVSIEPLEVQWPGRATVPLGVEVALTLEKNRAGVTSAKLSTGESRIELSGAIDDLVSPHGTFRYDARLSIADASRILGVRELQRGTVEIGGNAIWPGGGEFSATGNLRAERVDFQDSTITLRDCGLEGALAANPRGIELRGARLTGNYVTRTTRVPAFGRIANVALRGPALDLRGVVLAALGGTFEGNAQLREFQYYTVDGVIAGFEARRVVALYSAERLPWDAQASGPMHIVGTLGRKEDLHLSANLDISPAGEGAAVRGRISADYAARGETLDVGQSNLMLPASRLDFSGVLGRNMRVHLETHDLNDLLPALGESAASVPVKLENGSLVLDGTVAGNLEKPEISGRLGVTRFSYSGKTFDSLQAAVTASPDNVSFQDATLARGGLRAQFAGAIGPRDWKIGDDSTIAVTGSISNADITELAALLDAADTPVAGTLTAKARVGGTIASPGFDGDAEVTHGSVREEPFDRLAAHISFRGRKLEVTSGQVTAGPKSLQFSGAFDAAPERFDRGRLRLQVASNSMPLNRIQTLVQARPGLQGTVQVTANGALELVDGAGAEPAYRILDLHADVSARGLELTGQTLGNAHLSANSEGQVLRASFESDFANSAIRGQGEWRLEGDNPGSATVTFSRVDFAQIRAWLAPSKAGEPVPFTGSAEGELRIEGPAMKPAALKAELRIPKLEIGPPPAGAFGSSNLKGPPGSYDLHNTGPIVVTMANSVVTVESAHLSGRATDLTVSGKVNVDQKNALDLRVNGRIDLAILHDFDADLLTSGTVSTDATVRGAPDSPQVNGRMQFQDASFSVNDIPNGISKAAGAILFTGDRATIQSFSGETGGGKIELSGSAGYGGGQPVFQLHAHAEQVRVRYPEGVSTTADANLDLTGTVDRSMLSGSITVLRTGFNPQSDFSSLIARSAEPVRTPSVRTGLIGGLNLDVQINTSPDIQFQSSLTEDLQVEANLRLRGTATNPALIGRINVTQGQLEFYGTKYTINQGSIAFYNPVKIDPILDIDLETKARGIDITLAVTGPLNKPKLTPRSDPPLEFNEIVALLATGRTPTSDPTLLAQQSTTPQSWQQMGATALLGQAIANPVAGRLQRFFGVSRLRIDPTLPGVETNNPQARLTLEQQVSPAITFTYVTNVTTTNPEVVRVDWALSKQWSVVALRDENGTFGLDFFFKKRF